MPFAAAPSSLKQLTGHGKIRKDDIFPRHTADAVAGSLHLWLRKEPPRTPRSPSEKSEVLWLHQERSSLHGSRNAPVSDPGSLLWGENHRTEKLGTASVTWQGTPLATPSVGKPSQREEPGLQSGQERGPGAPLWLWGNLLDGLVALVVMDAEAPTEAHP